MNFHVMLHCKSVLKLMFSGYLLQTLIMALIDINFHLHTYLLHTSKVVCTVFMTAIRIRDVNTDFFGKPGFGYWPS